MNIKILSISFLFVLFLQGCVSDQDSSPVLNQVPEENSVAWQEHEIENVNTGEMITLEKINKPILLETFAVWCPTCKKQQDNIKELHELVGDDVFSISLDVDPNENKENVINHTLKNGFNWFFAVSPKELTNDLIDVFGVDIVNAPSVPIVLICPDKSYKKLKGGLKTSEELKAEIDLNC